MLSPFFVNEVYGLGYWLKDYGYYPKKLPLYTYMDHGMTFNESIPIHELENSASVVFKFSPRLVKKFKNFSKKSIYNIVNPTIHCRLKNKIVKENNATGTLFFPGHSTDLIDDLMDWDSFINRLKKIPEKYWPIDICLHPTDVKKGLDRIFEKAGYQVFTAGSAHDSSFTLNMYNILKRYKFTMSNLLGSYVFYSVEMGIPFSLYGTEPIYMNNADLNVEFGIYDSYKQSSTYQKALLLFNGYHEKITNHQSEFVEYELGKLTTISRLKTAYLLYSALIRYLVLHPRYTFNILKQGLKY